MKGSLLCGSGENHLIIHDGAELFTADEYNKMFFFTIKPNSQFYVND